MSALKPFRGRITRTRLKREVTSLRKKMAALCEERAKHGRTEKMLRRKQRQSAQELAERQGVLQNLLDDLLQSLFATGLELEAAKLLLETTPRKALRKLTQSTRQLNDAVRLVRSVLTSPLVRNA